MPATSSRPVVVITGAASGIGAATAAAFADAGWTVYATDIDPDYPATVEAGCRCLDCDVTDSEEPQAVVDRVLDETGRIDVLVNNAGFAVPGPVEDVSVEASRKQFDVVVHGTHNMTQAALPAMREQGRGRIIMLSSVLGVAPSTGIGTYGAAKAAVESLSDSLRMELRGTGVSVSLIEPAWVDTAFSGSAADRLPSDRTPAYSDIYETVESGWVVDGGPLAVAPEKVADTVVEAATADSPKARYPVGRRSRFVRSERWLPTSISDWSTPAFNRATITARRLWEFCFSSGSDAESTRRLSTGQEVSVPLSTHASISGVVLSASAEGVGSLLPSRLAPVRLTPRRGMVVIMSVDYSRIGRGEIDPYDEVAIMIPAVPDTGRLPLLSALSGGVGGYVWQLPVTTEPACALGREIWGYPKSVAEIDIANDDGVTRTRLAVEGQHVLSLAVEQPPTRDRELSLSSYTVRDGELQQIPNTFSGELGLWPLGRRADWSLGEHAWADSLRSVDLGSRPLARFGGNCEFTIGEPRVVGTR
ncbi:SDR family NAD(P)-dependent oxidoreductase [Halohasta litorea]|uniref:SDR family NAD(P)-dependent oxidoreductase n=1 Tax=Halohasta litorea TaxID=869891 RepID=A0ABD6D8D6_9EURY|nr:SDR family NAD(P)-dependent oxidoreductase [Halohasta litorea]